MAVKNKKPIKAADAKPAAQNRAAQIMFAIFAVILILSMVLSAVANY
ncbi:MAG: hypothetical protein HZB18_09030 [Chloroflexi bacterium]|nr:hypothetical protein [Chloroflexota bacterium]